MFCKNKKRVIATMIWVLATASILNAMNVDRPMPMKEAHKKYLANNPVFEKIRGNIIEYYETHDEYTGNTCFQEELTDLCSDYLKKFPQQGNSEKQDAVVVDVDETALSNYSFFKENDFLSRKGFCEYRARGKCSAIKPVLQLCKELKKRGYFIIFVSARQEDLLQPTKENLETKGFPVDELYLMPRRVFSKGCKSGDWKAEVRKELQKKYNIVANIGDDDADFRGDTYPYELRIPNYLY